VHVVAFGGRSPLIRLRQLLALASGLARFDPDVTVEAARRVRIEGDAATPVHVDGEMIGRLPLDIGIHPDRLPVICPGPD
jgi:diacylglycerol kinase family enzyme